MKLEHTHRHGLEVWVVRNYNGDIMGMFMSEAMARTRLLEIENAARIAAKS